MGLRKTFAERLYEFLPDWIFGTFISLLMFAIFSVQWVEGYSKYGVAETHSWPEYWTTIWAHPGLTIGGILVGGAIIGRFVSVVTYK
jgi:hypothetical protein